MSVRAEVAGGPHRRRRVLAWGFCAVCVVVGALYVPFVVGLPVPFEYYELLTPFTTWK
jgi:dolichyl-phosphate-mannose--protein O-mannosyl transferase